jgi:hypothetical protein
LIDSPLPPVLKIKTVATAFVHEARPYIDKDEHEMGINRTLKTIRGTHEHPRDR